MANMDSNQIANTLILSMNSIAENAVKKSGFDKTIEAIIIECKDPTLGKYKVKYQDAIFFAYSTNVETKYSNNSVVYITVPNGDMSKDKTIIRAKEHLGTTFNTILQKSQKYIKVGYKKIAGLYALHSYKPNGDSNIILNIDSFSNTLLQTYMKEGNTIYLSAKIRTDLDTGQEKSKGHYQLCVSMLFVSNADKNVTKVYNYILDEGSVLGNPYSLSGAVQTQFFEINNDNLSFNQIKEIKILSSGFNSNEDKQNILDIFFSDIEIGSAYKLSNDLLSGEFLNLNTPSGAFLNDSHNSLSILPLIRIKGQIVDKDSNNIQYYWFRENAKNTNLLAFFWPYRLQGWECLNETVKLNDNNVLFITNKPSITLYQSGKGTDKRFECIAALTRFKCVVIYCGSVKLSKLIIIHNSKSDYEINITTNSGNTIFYFNNGSTDLICNVYQKSTQTTVPNITYVWSVVSAAGDFTQLSETTNTIKNIKISSIINFATYQCSIFDSSGIFLGSNSIKIVNSLQKNYLTYSLTIVGGDKVFKYDTNGYSPSNSKYYIDPIAIEDLTFKLYNLVGVEIDQQLISEKAEITWRIPSLDTLLKNIYIGDNISNPYVADEETAANKGYICLSKTKNLDNNKDKLLKLPIAIEDMFSMKSNRDIYLIVDYNGHHVVTKTNFVFTKEGMNGNNGTEYTCSVRPIIDFSVLKVPENPTIYLYRNEDGTIASKKCNWRESLEDGSDWFKVTLYKNGQDIINSGASNINVTWSILKSKSNDVSFLSCVRKTNGAYLWSINNNFVFTDDNMDSISPSNIVEAKFSYDKTSFSGTLPINFVILPVNSTNLINFKLYTGFTEVMYNRFQVKPQYRDQYPFTILVTGSDNVTFSNKILPDNSFLLIKEENQYSNYYLIKLNPKAEYDGYNVNISLEVIVENIGRIFIPIHFMVNRYFSSVLNGWNGNSILLGDNKESMILAPQVAAGKKNNDNTFTGIVLGTQKDRDGSKTGLFGYNTGKQSIFLDANNGSAIFGIEDEGRIEFIPGKSAVIKSGNYNEKNKTGMQIDLSKPFIKYGSGNFSVNLDGILSAQGIKVSGTIRGSNIYGAYIASDDSNNPSFSLNENGTITGATIRGSNIYGAYIASDDSNNPSFSLNSSGTITGAIIRESNIYGAYIASDDSNNPSFSLNKEGTITGAAIQGSKIYGSYFANASSDPVFEIDGEGNLTIKDTSFTYSMVDFDSKIKGTSKIHITSTYYNPLFGTYTGYDTYLGSMGLSSSYISVTNGFMTHCTMESLTLMTHNTINGYQGGEDYGGSLSAESIDTATLTVRDDAKINGYIKDWSDSYRKPVCSITSSLHPYRRVIYMAGSTFNEDVNVWKYQNTNTLYVNAYWGSSSPTNKAITTNSSDIRLKKNITDTSIKGLNIINQIKVRQFDWKNLNYHQLIGIIADEVEKILPLLSTRGGYEEDGTMIVKSIQVLTLSCCLIKAIQLQQQLILELQSLIKRLKGEK